MLLSPLLFLLYDTHDSAAFVSEVRDTVLRALRDNLSLEDIRPELNNLKFSHYAEIEHFTSRSVDELGASTILSAIYFPSKLNTTKNVRSLRKLIGLQMKKLLVTSCG